MATELRPRGRPAGLNGDDLLAVAREVFLQRGYRGASMDEVARRARISKASLYREHASKSALYAAVVHHWTLAGRDAMRPALERLRASGDLRRGLVDLAETMRAGILSPPVVAMRRLVTAEAREQPEVAATYLEESWNTNIGRLAEALRALADSGRLRIEDPASAAEQFTWLVIGAPLNARMLGGDGSATGVDAAVDLFLAGYRANA
ncbi:MULTISPECIES: TetR/AcrR family transcriptional regulator [Microbacterium]|uniref:TetR/AcrR family transcriptional regulator n=1 Tax=Microbacterium algeriense TaxID=2615184 RepID=A0ABQ6V9A1_9MICO|nr:MULTISPECIES: TetR/AcrR family transcriptional regulator [Microbacterium]AZH79763.1 TetR family transcriptional regulator [Microbacterium sp. Y-01]KAB1866995.1 TetR/AcrR family transcriptional regulator [Microbacterium algeriense]MDX2400579.1 TetR/AcrR family transcriptional regulator [Microbacterium algeriense]